MVPGAKYAGSMIFLSWRLLGKLVLINNNKDTGITAIKYLKAFL
jgi:hypothetical protein